MANLNPSEVEDLEPAFKNNKNAKIVGGIYTKSDASGDIHKFCVNLEKVLVDKYNVKLSLDTEVRHISNNKTNLYYLFKSKYCNK